MPFSLDLRYSVDGAIPCVAIESQENLGEQLFIGASMSSGLYVGGFNKGDYSFFITTDASYAKFSIVKTFVVDQSYTPYLGLAIGSNKYSGLDAGIIFRIL